MSTIAIARDFLDLFDGRRDVRGLDAGGCQRLSSISEQSDSHWLGYVMRHLEGTERLGVYPLRDNNTCQWGCVDLDIKPKPSARYESSADAHTAALNLVNTLRVLGIEGWAERSRSGGFHVWVFADDWVSGVRMRRALLAACQIAGVDDREVNPKQERLEPGQVGNYVRLPFFGNPEGVDGFDPIYVTEDELARVSALYKPPPPVQWEASAYTEQHGLSGYVRTLIDGGPLEGTDRSGFLYKIAARCADDGCSPGAAFAAVRAADERLDEPKYAHRPNALQLYERLVSKAYGGG